MHEPVCLPTRDHPRVPARNLQNELRAPRVARFSVRPVSIVAPAYSRQPQHAARDPLAEHTERIEVREIEEGVGRHVQTVTRLLGLD